MSPHLDIVSDQDGVRIGSVHYHLDIFEIKVV